MSRCLLTLVGKLEIMIHMAACDAIRSISNKTAASLFKNKSCQAITSHYFTVISVGVRTIRSAKKFSDSNLTEEIGFVCMETEES